MKFARYFGTMLLCGAFCAAALADIPAAPPSTQPTVATTRPSRVKKPLPKGWVKIENATNHFQYFVPPTWKIDSRSDAQTNFTIPDKQGHPRGNVDVACTACHQETLEQAVAEQRDTIAKSNSGAKLIHDEATFLGDRSAWMFVAEDAHQMTMMGPKGPTKIILKTRMVSWIAVEGNMHYYVDMFTPAEDYTRNMAFTQRVTDSIEWTSPPATTQP